MHHRQRSSKSLRLARLILDPDHPVLGVGDKVLEGTGTEETEEVVVGDTNQLGQPSARRSLGLPDGRLAEPELNSPPVDVMQVIGATSVITAPRLGNVRQGHFVEDEIEPILVEQFL